MATAAAAMQRVLRRQKTKGIERQSRAHRGVRYCIYHRGCILPGSASAPLWAGAVCWYVGDDKSEERGNNVTGGIEVEGRGVADTHH